MREDVQRDTASMARKRHLASTARGLFGFCLAPSIRKQIRPIRLIRGKTEIKRTESLSPGVDNRCGSRGAFLYCQRQLFCFVAFRLPRADQTGGEVQSGKLACMDEHHYLVVRA